MINYSELYELLRKEKYSEALQLLPKKFLEDFKEFIHEQKETSSSNPDILSNAVEKSKKQLENTLAIFRELMIKRKKKILNLAFVATETGIMKRDYENMLPIEKEVFENLVKACEENDKKMAAFFSRKNSSSLENNLKPIILKEDIDQFVNHAGEIIGPFKQGEVANLDREISQILVNEKKASFVDD